MCHYRLVYRDLPDFCQTTAIRLYNERAWTQTGTDLICLFINVTKQKAGEEDGVKPIINGQSLLEKAMRA